MIQPVPEDAPAQADPVQGVPQQVPGPGGQGLEPGHVFVVRAGTVQAAQVDADARHMGTRAMGGSLRRGSHGTQQGRGLIQRDPFAHVAYIHHEKGLMTQARGPGGGIQGPEGRLAGKGAALEQTDDVVRPVRGRQIDQDTPCAVRRLRAVKKMLGHVRDAVTGIALRAQEIDDVRVGGHHLQHRQKAKTPGLLLTLHKTQVMGQGIHIYLQFRHGASPG